MRSHNDPFRRIPAAVSLGPHYLGAALPHPDVNDVPTALAGVRKRFTIKPPKVEPELLNEFRKFVLEYLEENYIPLDPETDLALETWLDSTDYPEWRKKELREAYDKMFEKGGPAAIKDLLLNSLFGKDEVYPEFKHWRGINSRSDEYKCLVGPTFKAIEKEVFKRPEFIKKIPVAERPQYIVDRLYRNDCYYIQTDYTAFESLFVGELMEACEMQLYKHMTKRLPHQERFIKLIRTAMLGVNICRSKHFDVSVKATRMSGEMCTSLGNSFSNLMFLKFMAKRKGCRSVKAVIEGDDGLSSMYGPKLTAEDFARLGLIIKLVIFENLHEASFCGLIFDPSDLINITDPFKILLTTFWTKNQYARSSDSVLRALLRAKCMSLLSQYPGCPVATAMGRYGMRMTSRYDGKMRKIILTHRMPTYEREKLISALHYYDFKYVDTPPPTNTRFLMEKVFGLSVENQIRIENFFDNKNDLKPFSFGFLDLGTKDQTDYFNKYSIQCKRLSRDLEFPPFAIGNYIGFEPEFTWDIGTKVGKRPKIVNGYYAD